MNRTPAQTLKAAVADLRAGTVPDRWQDFASKAADWLEMTVAVYHRTLESVAAGDRIDPGIRRPLTDLGHALTMARALLGEEQPCPRRGDAVEAWLKAQRDTRLENSSDRQILDSLLDLYRVHVDYGVPLAEKLPEEVADRG